MDSRAYRDRCSSTDGGSSEASLSPSTGAFSGECPRAPRRYQLVKMPRAKSSFAVSSKATSSVLFETGVGVRYLVEKGPKTRFPREVWPSLLARVVVIARGPKAAFSPCDLSGTIINYQVPEPNTWRETLALFDASVPINGLKKSGRPGVRKTERRSCSTGSDNARHRYARAGLSMGHARR